MGNSSSNHSKSEIRKNQKLDEDSAFKKFSCLSPSGSQEIRITKKNKRSRGRNNKEIEEKLKIEV